MNDPIALITADHREVEQLMDRLEAAEGDEEAQLFAQLDQALRLHMDIEEQLLYPLVEREVGEEEAEEAETEHGLASEGLDKLESLLAQPGFGAALAMLKGGVQHHVQEEENELLPELVAKLDEQERNALGDAIAEAKAAGAVSGGNRAAQERGERKGEETAAKKSAASAPARRRGESDERTKEELMEEARKRDIPGRSSMTKEELQKALERA